MQIEQRIVNYGFSGTTERAIAGIGVAAGLLGSGVVAYFDPARANFFPVCPVFAVTGCACPGCGLTRGFHALFNGNIMTALHFNLLIPVWAAIFVYVFVSLVLLAVRGKGLPMWPTSPRFMWVFMVALLTFGVLRNLPLYPFSLFFPS
jgi:hypothetical protein